ncbi:hypothetical protein ILYODFUR_025265 [Ilyodon furcidens]|uniref:Uncharacterized protein n=1 Tax=Ilyodon furcidens TaxID=33524 RepID=A0ABV0SP61_9TELE
MLKTVMNFKCAINEMGRPVVDIELEPGLEAQQCTGKEDSSQTATVLKYNVPCALRIHVLDMSTNSTSFINDSISLQSSSTNLLYPLFMNCFILRPSSLIFTSFILTYGSVMLPLCSLILYQGFQHWQQKSSTSSAATMSHSDCFTYNVVVMELIGVIGCIISCIASLFYVF